MTAQEIYKSVYARGGEFILNGDSVGVRGIATSVNELMTIHEHRSVISSLVRESNQPKLDSYDRPRNRQAVEERIALWKLPLTKSKGYQWDCRNWVTDWKLALLEQDIERYVKDEIEVATLHTSFRDFAESCKVNYHVMQDGKQIQTVVQQVQPSNSDFNRMLRLLNIDNQEYFQAIN